MSLVCVEGLCKDYPAFSLKDVSFSLEAGRITGFIGRNGAGKTTTIKSMLNLIHPSAGVVSYFGLPLIGNERIIKQRVGYSSGAFACYPRKTIGAIAEVTRSFYDAWDEGAYAEYLKLFSLDENKRPIDLSEGMKVKFTLLLALSHHAEVLILDEPTSGLDPFSRDELVEVFMELKRRGTCVFFSTHITSDLEKCADDILYIRQGKIVADMPVQSFREELGMPGETLEETVLRLERSGNHA